MNDTSPIPGSIPPPIPAQHRSLAGLPLGENPAERVPISGMVAAIETMLREPRRIMYQLRQQSAATLIIRLLIVAVVCSAIYGGVIGTFSGGRQLWAAPVKIAGGLLVAGLICLPSLYIFSCLSGSQARLVEVFGLVASLLALMTILLIGFAPVAWVFSQSTNSVSAMGALHLLFWAVSTYFGLRFLATGLAHLSADSQGGLKVWIVIFLLVALQMTTTLRPLVGSAETFWPVEKKFFVSHWMESLK